MRSGGQVTVFIIETVDMELLCPVLQARFEVHDLAALREALGPDAEGDLELQEAYVLDPVRLEGVKQAFSVAFEAPPNVQTAIVRVRRVHMIENAPYLIHTNYELFLLMDGRKKLARMGDAYPPVTFPGEAQFDHWVSEGFLHREEVREPFDEPVNGWEGRRTVYYTPKDEAWRIPAMRLIWKAAGKSGGWNEHFERLEGMLFGYEEWQNDWWIERGLRRGGFSGMRLCCAVDLAGLDWMEAAGFRALPPIKKSHLPVMNYDADDEAKMRDFMLSEPESVALVTFNIFGLALPDLRAAREAQTWQVAKERIAEVNKHLRRPVMVVARRRVTIAE